MDKVRVSPSSTHGSGVFATRIIRKGEKITQYPEDLVFENDRQGRGYKVIGCPHGTDYIKAKVAIFEADDDQLLNYLQHVKNDIHVYGDPSIHSPKACAHLINDAVKLDKIDCNPAVENIGKGFHAYLLQSVTRLNCMIETIKGKCWAVATRDIQDGDELFTSYGYQYWIKYPFTAMENHLYAYVQMLNPRQNDAFYTLISAFNGLTVLIQAGRC